jgi:hypothetical protein
MRGTVVGRVAGWWRYVVYLRECCARIRVASAVFAVQRQWRNVKRGGARHQPLLPQPAVLFLLENYKIYSVGIFVFGVINGSPARCSFGI